MESVGIRVSGSPTDSMTAGPHVIPIAGSHRDAFG